MVAAAVVFFIVIVMRTMRSLLLSNWSGYKSFLLLGRVAVGFSLRSLRSGISSVVCVYR